MKNKASYLSAFTIIELLVSLLISGLLIGFVYYIYTNLTQLSVQYQNTHLTLNDYEIAKADLKRELEISNKILPYPKGFTIIKNKQQINYFTDDQNLIKQTNQGQSVLFKTIKSIILNYELDEVGLKTNQIKSISIVFLVENQELSVYLYRFVDSKEKLNTTLLNEY